MKIQLFVTSDNGTATSVTVEGPSKAYSYVEALLYRDIMLIFQEGANGLPHSGKPYQVGGNGREEDKPSGKQSE